jgi:transposase
MRPGPRIDYKALRKVNPETARLAVLEYHKTNGGNVSDTARTFGINRSVVYDILRKQQEGDMRDRSRVPKRQPNKTAPEIEDRVVKAKNKTHMGHKRLSIYLKKYEGLTVPAGTIRHILRRNRDNLDCPPPRGRSRHPKRTGCS